MLGDHRTNHIHKLFQCSTHILSGQLGGKSIESAVFYSSKNAASLGVPLFFLFDKFFTLVPLIVYVHFYCVHAPLILVLFPVSFPTVNGPLIF